MKTAFTQLLRTGVLTIVLATASLTAFAGDGNGMGHTDFVPPPPGGGSGRLATPPAVVDTDTPLQGEEGWFESLLVTMRSFLAVAF